jgi:hypothetical protein
MAVTHTILEPERHGGIQVVTTPILHSQDLVPAIGW